MAVVTMKNLLDSGVHFGHQTRRWNPKMKRFIFTERNGIYIIDLQQTIGYIDRAYEFVKETVAHGGTVLFIGTKKQAQEAIAEQSTRVGMPYVNQRWLGGMLTNFSTVYKRLQRLKELEAMEENGWEGTATKKEHLAVAEAHKLNIPVIAILDTNCDPDEVDYKIPGNDDAIRSAGLLTRVIADAVAEGLMQRAGLAANAGRDEKPEPGVLAADEPLADWETELLKPTQTEPAPAAAETAPTEATPTEAAPTEAAPTEAAPTEAAQAAPAEAAPAEAATAAPAEAAATEAAPTDAAPDAPTAS